MYFPYRIPQILIGVGIVLVQQQQICALDATQVADVAKNITVLIDGQNPGSGVIISKKDKTYYVLTAKHVVATQDEYEIIAPDKKKYPLDYSKVKKLADVDLAIVQFTSDSNYTVAKIGDSTQAKQGSPIFVYGFPKPGREIKERIDQFTEGQITGNSSLNDGYGLIYSNVTRAGMSGGPVLNERGLLVGIHGRADSDVGDDGKSIKSGFNLGIPINTFMKLAEGAGIKLALQKETAPGNNNNKKPSTATTTPPPNVTNIPGRPSVIRSTEDPSDTICAGAKCN
jgi:S1-C subfamily serine protease